MNGSRGEMKVFETAGLLAQGLAQAFADSARAAVSENGRFAVALAGGTTPKAAYSLLAQEPYSSDIPWQQVQIFFGDERCVPPEDADSNYKMAAGALLTRVPIPPQNIHRMRGEDEPALAASDYAELLITLLGETPRFDLVLLGMGPDGHTASLFPGSDPRADEAQLVRAVWVPSKNAHRLTLTPAVINNAREVIVATEGAAKAAALRDVREGPFDPVLRPVQIVAPSSGTLRWFADSAAASLLR